MIYTVKRKSYRNSNDEYFVHNSQEAGPSHAQSERNIQNNLESSPLDARPHRVATPCHSDQVEEGKIFYHCRKCPFTCNNKRDLYLHRMREHYQHGGALHTVPWGDNPAPWEREDDTIDERLQEVYQANEPLILQNHDIGPVESTYNFPVGNDLNVDQLMRYVDEIYREQQYAFRLNLSFGVILQNRETGDYRYFTAYTNNVVLENPMHISRRPNLRGLYLKLRRMDILNELLHTRPDTKLVPVLLTNVLFYVTSTKYPVGVGNLPEYLMTRESIYPLVKNQNTGRPYDDHLCLFRCLALHNGYDIKSVDTPAKQYYQDWRKFSKSNKEFCGVSFEEFPEFERCFQINLEVYSLQESGVCISIYKSRGRQDTNLYINLYENHASYIKNFASFAKKFQCKTCERHFDYSSNLKRHEATCASKTKYFYPGGFFKSNQTVFQKLEHYNIDVPVTDRTFPWFIVYDFEAMLEKVDQDQTPYLKWTRKHIPISVSVCSNVPGYTEPFCIVDENCDQLVSSMVSYMHEISSKVLELAGARWDWIFEKLQYSDTEVIATASVDEGDDGEMMQTSAIQRIMDELKSYMKQVPHMLNCGQEKRVGKYPVDGYDVTKNTIYQFHGCYYHGHSCPVTRDIKDEKWLKTREQKFTKTQATTRYLQQQGYKVIELWECQYKEFCRQHPKMYDVINKSRPDFFQKHKYKNVTEDQILQAVVNDQLFGAIEVDIEVPEQWPSYFQHPSLTPFDFFAEMCPLFCNTDVPFDAIASLLDE
ncbi:hypothetical protein KUTeg_010638 [Tegillarca granosa]|uniref:C2H2-type domain-containing protein n=1 Tax=Tegillarca granosa TaxID=220873 RepID=A0ABQ9F341_TEGGR|nr:hypothetical protein KUTeg_010638 [Tegillarca granosa]